MRIERSLSFMLAAVAAAAVITGAFGVFNGGSATVTHAGQDNGNGTAAFTMMAPVGAQTVVAPNTGATFTITNNLTAFAPAGIDAGGTWAGWNTQITYDSSVLEVPITGDGTGPSPFQAEATAGALCVGAANFASPPPQDVGGTLKAIRPACFAQNSTVTSGVLETLFFRCIANGTSDVTYIPDDAPLPGGNGTALFDGFGLDYNTSLSSATVICGTGSSGPTPTATNTVPPTATNTVGPTATNTATATATNTATSPEMTQTSVAATATFVAGQTATAVSQTQTAVAGQTSVAQTATASAAAGSGAIRSATPTPGGATAVATGTTVPGTTPSTGGGSPAPGGGPGGVSGVPTKPGGGTAGVGIGLPNTGSGGSGGFGTMTSIWLILGGILLAGLGGGIYVRSRRRAH